jgi:D-amino peptidase
MHARAGQAGVISHVIDWPRITEVRVNGMPVSEAHLTIGLAEHFHIPCVLVTGDNVICGEVSEWLHGGIETAVVKRSFSRYSARCLVLKKTQALIREAAYRAMKSIQEFKREHFDKPLSLEADFTDRQVARYVSWMPQLKYDGDRTVSYEAEDFLSLHKTLFAMQALAHLD